jgi:hypothetical protein
MNISLTILCSVVASFAIAVSFLGQDDVEHGAIFPWHFIGSIGLGFLITHGEYFQDAYRWIHTHLNGDGTAGVIASAGFACLVAIGVASMPMSAGITLHILLSAWDARSPLAAGAGKTRRARIVALLRRFAIR